MPLTIITENIAALEALHLLVKTLDLILLAIFCIILDDPKFPTLGKFIKFLEKYCLCQETVTCCQTQSTTAPRMSKVGVVPKLPKLRQLHSNNFLIDSHKCVLCKDLYTIYTCPRFLSTSPKERFGSVKDKKLHHFKDCSSSSCYCQSRHHSLLHFTVRTTEEEVDLWDPSAKSSTNVFSVAGNSKLVTTVLLSTTVIDIQHSSGYFQTIRTLFDYGSQAHFIIDNCLSRLGLARKRISVQLHGLSFTPLSATKGMATCVIKPTGQDAPIFEIDAFVLHRIIGCFPSTPIKGGPWSQHFNSQIKIGMWHGQLTCSLEWNGLKLEGSPGNPMAFDTQFGCILMVHVQRILQLKSKYMCPPSAGLLTLEYVVQKFLELDVLPVAKEFRPRDD
ncbi:hypothetical protein PR048_032684 [Dryococelus australis]|uniref:Uncharacterized protein n=1 Tax=Dryococelus australis TaxID=614101 RepID=A0ABQ9G3N3_9NEOP|nr:hypothetical protein PR048_032684 [Dryococelus australis]